LVFRLTALPFIRSMLLLDGLKPSAFKLALGRSAETSGGLLIALPDREAAEKFVEEYKREENCESWIIGTVELAQEEQQHSTAVLETEYTVIDV
jgi:hypothetical protein